MAKLRNRRTDQVVEGVDEEIFRRDVQDPEDWDTEIADERAEESPEPTTAAVEAQAVVTDGEQDGGNQEGEEKGPE